MSKRATSIGFGKPCQYKPARAGVVLLEFALIAFILIMLLAFIFDFGRAVYSAQVVEQAADFIARELAVTPLAAELDFTKKLGDPALNKALRDPNIYSEDFLVVDITGQPSDRTLLQYLDDKKIPSANRLLIPLMVVMDSTQNSNIPQDANWLVYPGAIVASQTGTSETGFTVRIPLVSYGPGSETIAGPDDWLHVVEVDAGQFKLSSPSRGLASVRVNYPFQATGLAGRYRDPKNPDQPPATPKDAYIEAQGEDLQPGQRGGPYAGPTGLGQQAAFTKTVRPFRRIVSGQGVYRREIFQ